MSGLTVSLVFCAIILFIFLLTRRNLLKKDKRYPKGPVGFPVIGHLPLFGKYPPNTFMRWWKSYGAVFCLRLGSWNTVVVNGYSAVKAAAEHPDDAFSGRPNFVTMEMLKERNSEDSFAFGNFSPSYLKQRKVVSKALRLFTFKKPEVVEELISKEATAFADLLINKYGNAPSYIEFDVQIFVVRVIYQFLYGRGKYIDVERHVKVIMNALDKLNKFTGSGSIIDVLPWLRYIMPWRIDTFRKLVTETDEIMWEQVRDHYTSFSKDVTRDVTDAILQNDVDDETKGEEYIWTRSRLSLTLSDLQAAGSDTTNKTLTWLFLYMAAFPQVQERVFAEIEDVVGRDQNVKLKDRASLVYTNAVIYEVMRIVPQLPFAVPHYAVKDGTIEGYHVDKGTVVILNLYSVHYEKEFWEDPEYFRPERLILENSTLDKEKCNHILSFGLGRRRCVGEHVARMNVFLSFSIIMQKCKFVKPADESLDLTPLPGLVYSPKDFKVHVLERN